MRSFHLATALVLALGAGLALADDEAQKLQLLPKPEKGQKERLVFATTIDRTTKKDEKTHQGITTEIVRKIKSLGEDGLSAKEALTFEKTEFEYEDETGARQKQSAGMTLTYPIERSSKSRRALVEEGAPEIPDGIAPQLMAVLRRDPDALARTLSPADAVKVGDTWKPDLAQLLLVLGPKKAKLVLDDSKAEAKLESLKKKNDHATAEITLDATLVFTLPDDPESKVKMKIEATLKGPTDGSSAPTHEEITTKTKNPDGSKETLSVDLERKKVDADEKDAQEK